MSTQKNNEEILDLARFRERLGLEAFMINCIASTELPRESLMCLFKIGRHFGPLTPGKDYEAKVLGELLRLVAVRPEILGEILERLANGFLSLATVRKIAEKTPA